MFDNWNQHMGLQFVVFQLTKLSSMMLQGKLGGMNVDIIFRRPKMLLFWCQIILLVIAMLSCILDLISCEELVSFTKHTTLCSTQLLCLSVLMDGAYNSNWQVNTKSQSCSTIAFIFYRSWKSYLACSKLFRQMMVDAYAKIECERLQFLHREQKQLREDSYKELQDTVVNNDLNGQTIGQR